MNKGIFYDIPEKYKYSFAFNSQIKSVISEDKDKYLSKASIDQIRKFIPDIDSRKIDLLPFSANCFVANRLNENSDGLSTKEAILAVELCPLSFIDVEHSRKDLIGVITTAGFSEFGTDKILTKEEIVNSTKPFNVWVGGVFWKVPNPDLTNYIEETNNPDSKEYLAASISWEIAYSDFDLITINANKRNFEDGEIITDSKKINELINGLKGKRITSDGKRIGIIPKDDILFMGVGVTNSPAAAVKGIAINTNNNSNAKKSSYGTCPECGVSTDKETMIDPENQDNIICGACQKSSKANKWKKGVDTEIIEEKANKNDITSSIDIKILTEEVIKLLENDKKYENIAKSLSHIEKVSVNSNSNKFMKVKNIKDLTGESLKEITASEVQELYAQDLKQQLDSEIKKISDEFEAKKAEKDNAIKSANAEIIKLGESVKDINNKYTELDKKAKEVEDNYNKLVKANQEKEKVEVFSARLQTMDEEFNLSEDEKKIVGDELKAIDSDEAFAAYKAKMDILLAKSKKVFDPKTKKWVNKEDLKDKGKDDSMENPDGTKKTAKASTNVVDEVSKEGKVVTPTIPNTSSTEKTLTEKALEAFGASGWSFEPSKRNRKSNN